MTLSEALAMARDGVTGVVTIDEPWIYKHPPVPDAFFGGSPGNLIASPGEVELDYLRSLVDVRAWTPGDAR